MSPHPPDDAAETPAAGEPAVETPAAGEPAGDTSAADGRGRRRAALVAPLVVVALLACVLGVLIGSAASRASNPTAAASADDAAFVADMLDHHTQAVAMAEFALAQSDNPTVTALAAQVISDQRWELGWMESWLTAHGLTRPGPDRTVMAWMGMPVPHDQMPGLVSQEDLVAFYNLTGTDLDRRFLELMREHHEGGVHMAEWEAISGDDPALRDLAKRMVVKQRDEINDITAMLA